MATCLRLCDRRHSMLSRHRSLSARREHIVSSWVCELAIEWYRNLMLSSSYMKVDPGVLVWIRVFGRRCSDIYSFIIEINLSLIHVCIHRFVFSTTCQLFRRLRYGSHKAKRYIVPESLQIYVSYHVIAGALKVSCSVVVQRSLNKLLL